MIRVSHLSIMLTGAVIVMTSYASETAQASRPEDVVAILTDNQWEPTPAPIPELGFRVLIVYETTELSRLTWGQLAALYSSDVHKYLNQKCITGPDNKTREWRQWDKDVDTTYERKLWQDAMNRPRKSLPWVIISNGKTGYEGPLPDGSDQFLNLLKKYGG